MSAPENLVSVHSTAIVEEGACLGEGTRIWHHAHVRAGASIGARCTLGKDVFVAGTARIGEGVRIQNGVSVYDGVVIEDDVFVGPHVVFTNVRAPRAFARRMDELEPTIVERGASLGAGAVIVCGHRVGAYAFVGAGAVVTHDVAPHALVVGNPARRIGWVSRAGRRLPEGRVVACPDTGERYLVEADACRALAEGEEPPPAPVPFCDLAKLHAPLLPELEAAFRRVARSGKYVLGDEVLALEDALAEVLGGVHAIGVSSGTDALLVALMAIDVGPGDEVITSPLSFFASAGVIARLGARPVFVDVEPHTCTLDPSALRDAITARTRAIVPVHLFGRTCDPEVFAIAEAHGVPVVEDAAQALFASNARGAAGTLGALGCFSFFPTKNLGALGDGGLVVTHDTALAERVRLLRAQGARPRYHHVAIGGNFRLDALQAALLRVKLPHVARWNAERRDRAARYDTAFASLAAAGALTLPAIDAGHVVHQYVVRTPHRDALRGALAARGIATEIYYPEPLHLAPCFSELGHTQGRFPEAERACREGLALPIAPGLASADEARVIAAVVAYFEGAP